MTNTENGLTLLVRLRRLNHEAQAELMERDREYANIICRCELVSEAEIRAAIRRGATTVDGIKLRTRATEAPAGSGYSVCAQDHGGYGRTTGTTEIAGGEIEYFYEG